MLNQKKELVSIIMPAYNCEKYIQTAIQSVINQTYLVWELIVVDDHSTDQTLAIARSIADNEPRISIIELSNNQGGALARNKGIKKAQGKYIAFLDSDDVWGKEKLQTQICFMKENNYHFTATSYSKIDEYGNSLNKIIKAKTIQDYKSLLKYCPGNSTIIYNADQLGKFYIINLKKRNDYFMWLGIIKKSKVLYGLDSNLSSHRLRQDSLSTEKSKLVKYHWYIYYRLEKLGFWYSLYLTGFWIFKTIKGKLLNG
ncbi:glycosyltransferase family 2 protein [Enterococcus rivorum]|uniref:Glycosyl transferase n=1 Tax=Enterococcus rivorum TaxID=762845 RepID=A0A1E5KX55_9ENTE|nr:glycosyltransferase family 2 protein [Enterococcus rivorum]MBP2097201.1 glycosyltransferase involved in cell wall biosynthesis [Enterococcus rivorum]OEH82442.1 glycosyl transferase [Enterococcus rivorum]